MIIFYTYKTITKRLLIIIMIIKFIFIQNEIKVKKKFFVLSCASMSELNVNNY